MQVLQSMADRHITVQYIDASRVGYPVFTSPTGPKAELAWALSVFTRLVSTVRMQIFKF